MPQPFGERGRGNRAGAAHVASSRAIDPQGLMAYGNAFVMTKRLTAEVRDWTTHSAKLAMIIRAELEKIPHDRRVDRVVAPGT